MSELVRVKLPDGAEVSVGKSFAQSHGLEPLNKPAADARGNAIRTKMPVDLKGQALNQALSDAGLSTTGTAAEKRDRLADHQTSVAQPADGTTTTNPAGSDASASQTEE